jgi:two-component sensor histidine kinase
MPGTNAHQLRLSRALERIDVHDHLCLIYNTIAEQFISGISFVQLGLKRGERCLYITQNPAAVAEALQAAGMELPPALDSGALMVTTPPNTFLKQGYFDPDWMIHYWNEAIQSAKAAGFAALRVASDMTWAASGGTGAEHLMQYEAKLCGFLPRHDMVALCQYNSHCFTPELMLDAIRTHPLVITGHLVCKNYYYVPPAEFLGPKQTVRHVERWLNNIQKRQQAEEDLQSNITQHKLTEEALQQRNRDLALLSRVSMVFISTLDLDQVLSVVLEEVRQVLRVLACSAWLIDTRTGELVCRQVTDPQGKVVLGWRLAPGQGLAGWSVQQGQSLIIGDVESDARHYKGVDRKTGLPVRSILTVPLRVKQKIIGVIQVVDATINRFNETDLTLLESLAATAAAAIENARLYEQVHQEAEAKMALLHEVNHRVKNNLAAIIGLLYAAQRQTGLANQSVYQTILTDLVNRIQGLATVHSLLSASEWAPLSLSELTRQIIRSSLQAAPRDKAISVTVTSSPVQVTPDQAHNLALIINELTTNTVRHALHGRDSSHIIVNIWLEDEIINFQFRDDGPGYPAQVLQFEQHGVGFDLIQPLVRKSLRGELSLFNQGGAVTHIRFRAHLDTNEEKLDA